MRIQKTLFCCLGTSVRSWQWALTFYWRFWALSMEKRQRGSGHGAHQPWCVGSFSQAEGSRLPMDNPWLADHQRRLASQRKVIWCAGSHWGDRNCLLGMPKRQCNLFLERRRGSALPDSHGIPFSSSGEREKAASATGRLPKFMGKRTKGLVWVNRS